MKEARWTECGELVCTVRSSKKTLLFLVFLTIALDYLLLTVVVPIIPGILMQIDINDDQVRNDSQGETTVTDIQSMGSDSTARTEKRNTSRGEDGLIANKHVTLRAIHENSKTGIMLASKALVQIVVNPLVGILTNRFGSYTLFIGGTVILSSSPIIYSAASTYGTLLLARIVHGVGSACSVVAGLSLLAEIYQDDTERSKAFGIAMSGMAIGTLVGYPYGSVLYTYTGKIAPFLIIAVLFIFVILLQFWLQRESYSVRSFFGGKAMYKILIDPYVLVTSAIIMLSTMSIANLEPTVPIWMMETMKTPNWQLGLVFVPDSVGYLIGTKFFGVVAKTIGRWLCSIASMLLMGLCLFCMPFATSVPQLILPQFGLGLGIGVIDASLFPLLALLIDIRHQASYGSVYAIANLAVCLAYGIGPLIVGHVIKDVTFKWFMWGMAVVMVISSPISLLLKKFSAVEEKQPILGASLDYASESSINYKTLNEDE